MRGKMKLSEVIATWEILYVKETGELGYCDLLSALEHVGIRIENDCLNDASSLRKADQLGDF